MRRPTNSAESELPRSPWSTTSTRNTSTTWPNWGQRLMPTKWTSAARVTVAKNLRTSNGTVLLDLLGHGLVVQQVDLVERAEVHGRGELDAMEELPTLLDGHHGADRDAPRIDAVDAGR